MISANVLAVPLYTELMFVFYLLQESTGFLKHLISTKWVQSKGLKYLYASLYNVGIVFYKTNRLKEVLHILLHTTT